MKKFYKYSNYLLKKVGRLDGLTFCITGSTGGLAYHFERYLLFLGATLILTARSMEKLDKRVSALKEEFPDATIKECKLDLSKVNSIVECSYLLKNEKIDYLINNAATYHLPLMIDEDTKYELTFLTNFIGPHLFTLEMLTNFPTLTVLNCSSLASIGKLNLDDIMSLKTKNKTLRYGRSKRLNLLDTILLSRRFPDATFYQSHPGVTATSLFNVEKGGFKKAFNVAIVPLMKLIFPDPLKASLPLISSISDKPKKGEIVSPSHFFQVYGYPKTHKIFKNIDLESELAIVASIVDESEKYIKNK